MRFAGIDIGWPLIEFVQGDRDEIVIRLKSEISFGPIMDTENPGCNTIDSVGRQRLGVLDEMLPAEQ